MDWTEFVCLCVVASASLQRRPANGDQARERFGVLARGGPLL